MNPRAICWASGQIEFIDRGARLPKGAIAICSGNSIEECRDKISSVARLGYHGDFLVPGVPEATSPDAAYEALVQWMDWAFFPRKVATA